MNQYLTINEFAKLRNVNANSLRYYEKLNLLIPAKVDPQTKYRYYALEQLVLLDMILLCIRLGIPLKELSGYIDEKGGLNAKGVFEYGKQIMKEKIADMQSALELAEFNLKTLEQNQEHQQEHGVYMREIEERFFFVEPFRGNWDDLIQKEQSAMELFRNVQEMDMVPVFPAGILMDREADAASFSFFVQILNPHEHDRRMVRIPRGKYACLQTDLTPNTDISAILAARFPSARIKRVIISSMLMNELQLGSRHIEIQCRLDS